MPAFLKNFAFALILIISGGIGQAQSILPLPDSGAVWVNTYGEVIFHPRPHCPVKEVTNYCAPGEDTLINSLTYSKLMICGGLYKGGFRNDSGRVYFIPSDSTQEYLLYDFTVDVGDTVEVYYESFGGGVLGDVIIQQIDSLLLNGVYHRLIYNTLSGDGWLEGVGNLQGILMESYNNISNYCLRLHCCSENGVQIYGDNPGGASCPLDFSVEEKAVSSGLIYPNPARDILYFDDFDSPPENIKVYDISGKLLYHIDRADELQLETHYSGALMIEFEIRGEIYREVVLKL
jgi:hypothetical protein